MYTLILEVEIENAEVAIR